MVSIWRPESHLGSKIMAQSCSVRHHVKNILRCQIASSKTSGTFKTPEFWCKDTGNSCVDFWFPRLEGSVPNRVGNAVTDYAVSCGYAHMQSRFFAYALIYSTCAWPAYWYMRICSLCACLFRTAYVSAYTNKSKHLYFKTDYGVVLDHHLPWMNTHNLYN